MAATKTHLAVIGGGPGGYAAAFLAADLGLEVTLIDPGENPGGVCLYRGCIPSKTLLQAAKLIHEVREAESWGLSFGPPQIDAGRLQAHKNEVVARLTGGLGQLIKRRKIGHLRARASFADNHTLDLETVGGEHSRLGFDHAIIATGSHPVVLPGLQVDSPHLLDATAALDLDRIPKHLLVIGGGYIGLELGTVYAALGARVSVVEMTPGLLPGADGDLVRVLQRSLTARLEAIRLNTMVTGIRAREAGLDVTWQGPAEEDETRRFDKVLVAVGRRPNSARLGLENTAVAVDAGGFVAVDDQRRTTEPHIFAVGDVAGEPMLAHKASHEGRVAVEAIAGRPAVYRPAAVPAVVFTDPEIAWAGCMEVEARAKNTACKVTRFPWAASGRAATLGRSDGMTKLVIDPQSERILGIGIVGPGAGEMIAEGVLAIEMDATVNDLARSIHPHPTLSETVMEAADMFHGTATHVHRPRRRS